MNRYEWEDCLIDAQAAGVLSNGALLVALKLARAVNWNPKDSRPAGLYWKNNEAFRRVGVGRGTYYNHKQELFDLGFFKTEKGNLIPLIPESIGWTEKVHRLDSKSPQAGLQESIGCNPFSEDTLSEDTLSEEDSVEVADAPSPPSPNHKLEKESTKTHEPSLTTREQWLEKAARAAEYQRQQREAEPPKVTIKDEW